MEDICTYFTFQFISGGRGWSWQASNDSVQKWIQIPVQFYLDLTFGVLEGCHSHPAFHEIKPQSVATLIVPRYRDDSMLKHAL